MTMIHRSESDLLPTRFAGGPIYHLGRDAFLRWLRDGIAYFPQADSETDESGFWFQLPSKYARLAASGGQFVALIDELEVVSLCNPVLTREWQVRLRNQGEEWLPFRFREDWFTDACTEKARSPGSEPEPEPTEDDTQSAAASQSGAISAIPNDVPADVAAVPEPTDTVRKSAAHRSKSPEGSKAAGQAKVRSRSHTSEEKVVAQPALPEQLDAYLPTQHDREEGDEPKPTD